MFYHLTPPPFKEWYHLAVWLTTMVWLTSCGNETAKDNVLAHVTGSLTKNKLVAEARLTPEYLSHAMGLLSGGESLLVSYEFVFQEQKEWLPDRTLSEITVRRRLRRSLILERYEMQELRENYSTFTADDNEAAQFLGNPHFIPISQREDLKPDHTYLITATFRLDEEGVSRMLRVLRDWIFFWETNAHSLQTEYRLP